MVERKLKKGIPLPRKTQARSAAAATHIAAPGSPLAASESFQLSVCSSGKGGIASRAFQRVYTQQRDRHTLGSKQNNNHYLFIYL